MSDDALAQGENKTETVLKKKYPGFLKGNKARLGKGTPKDIKELRAMTRDSFERNGHRLVHAPLDELMRIKNDPKSTVMELMMVSIIVKAIKEGDEKRLNFFWDRLVGKVVQPLTLQPEAPPPQPIMIETGKLSDEALNELMGVIDVTPVK